MTSRRQTMYQVFRVKMYANAPGYIDWLGGNHFTQTRTNAKEFKKADAVKAVQALIPAQGYVYGVASRKQTVSQVLNEIARQAKYGRAKNPATRRNRNPVGPTRGELETASRLYADFRGSEGKFLDKMPIRAPKSGLVIGDLDGVLYTTIRDGKREK